MTAVSFREAAVFLLLHFDETPNQEYCSGQAHMTKNFWSDRLHAAQMKKADLEKQVRLAEQEISGILKQALEYSKKRKCSEHQHESSIGSCRRCLAK